MMRINIFRNVIMRSIWTAASRSSANLNVVASDVGTQTLKATNIDSATQSHGGWQHFASMKKHCNPIDNYTYARALTRCSSTEGKIIHAHIIKFGDDIDMVVWTTLLHMYAKCGFVKLARLVFDGMSQRNLVSWTAMIGGYSQHGYREEALRLFCALVRTGLEMNEYSFVCVVKACAPHLQHGEQLHCLIIKYGFERDTFVGTAMVDTYAKCGSIAAARKVFCRIAEADVVAWTAMITGYAQNGHSEEAVELYRIMVEAGMKPNHFTYSSVLRACDDLTSLELGKQVHAHIIKNIYQSNVFVGIALIDLYANCGEMENAFKEFEELSTGDSLSWTAMIVRCAQNGLSDEALTMFRQMQEAGAKPNQFTFVGVVNACASLQALEQGKQIHAHLITIGCEVDLFVASALVNVYAKCSSIQDARNVFDKMPHRNEVSWNTMIVGYVQLGYGELALKLLCEMRENGFKPKEVAVTSSLRACASLSALQQGLQLHAYISKTVFWSDVCVGNALVDMYAKCGNITDAHRVFDQMPTLDEVSWNTIIAGYAHHGLGENAIKLFEEMKFLGLKPDHITFISVLSACSHAGLVDEGRWYFDSMTQDYGILPTMEHYTCMVNLVGRSGHLSEAEEFIQTMPIEPGIVVWQSLLSACKIHGDVELGVYAAKRAQELEPQNDATQVLLSNIYAAAGRWDDVAQVRKLMDGKGLKKDPGLSWIVVKRRAQSQPKV